eukprot:TRINITY_DN45498_c0_g1_i1.p1 TRINITY_DN45498_c0_g1~~TRINITY_DN45498_c0_g1_i1.p1  ORF type:complete len:252 (+),score=30.11 TRINITY_DN45498_c0_g1_i1:86-757(+)
MASSLVYAPEPAVYEAAASFLQQHGWPMRIPTCPQSEANVLQPKQGMDVVHKVQVPPPPDSSSSAPRWDMPMKVHISKNRNLSNISGTSGPDVSVDSESTADTADSIADTTDSEEHTRSTAGKAVLACGVTQGPRLKAVLREVAEYLLASPGYIALISEIGNTISLKSRKFLRSTRLRLAQVLRMFPDDFAVFGDGPGVSVQYLHIALRNEHNEEGGVTTYSF